MKHARHLIPLLLLVASLFASCSDTPPTTVTTDDAAPTDTAAVETDSTEIRYTPKNTDYGNTEFRILNYDIEGEQLWTGIPNDLFMEEEASDILATAVFNRNQAVEDALNIRIVGENMGWITMRDYINKSTMADTDDFDAAFPNIYALAALISAGHLSDLYDTDIDFSMPWWDQNSIDTFDLSGILFAATSDATYYDKLSTYVTYFNSKLITDLSMENPYDLVMNGTWTLDKMLEMGEAVSKDMNGDGKYNKEDAFGLSCQNDAAYILLHAANEHMVTKDTDGTLTYNLLDEHVVTTLQRINDLMSDNRRFFNRQTYSMDMVGAINMFTEDRVLFLIRPIQSLFMMRDMEADFGVVTLPKMEESQAYAGSAVNPNAANIFVLPTVVKDKARTTDVLQLLACESYYRLKEPLYDLVLGSKLTRDERAPIMLDRAFANRIYDVGLVWNFGGISEKLMTTRTTDIVSKITSWEKEVNKAIGELNDIIASMQS